MRSVAFKAFLVVCCCFAMWGLAHAGARGYLVGSSCVPDVTQAARQLCGLMASTTAEVVTQCQTPQGFDTGSNAYFSYVLWIQRTGQPDGSATGTQYAPITICDATAPTSGFDWSNTAHVAQGLLVAVVALSTFMGYRAGDKL